MKSVVIVDSMSNIPEHVLKTRKNIKQIPLNIDIENTQAVDIVDTEGLRKFYREKNITSDSKPDATSPSPEQISVFLLNEVAPYYDCAIFQSTSAALSEVFNNIKECAETIENEARVVRKMAGLNEPFKLIFSNSGNSSSGQTILALYTDAVLAKGVDPTTAVENADSFKKSVKTYSVISDIMQARTRMKMVGHKTVSMTSAVSGQIKRNAPLVCISNDVFKIVRFKIGYKDALDSLFSYAEQSIKTGLHLPIIHVSYAGRIRELHGMEGFKSLQETAKAHGVTVISGMMSASACINYSMGSVSLGIAPKDQDLDPE